MKLAIGKFGLRASLNPFQFEVRSNLAEPDKWLVEYAGGHPTSSGQVMTERTAVQLSAVFAAVNLISHAISSSPLKLFQTMPDGVTQREAIEHPLYALLRWPPNGEMTKQTFWNALMGHALLWGNGYAEIVRDGAGRPVEMWPLRPDRTFPRRTFGPSGKATGPLIYVARSGVGPEKYLRPDQVLHFMGYSYDGLRGLSPVALHRESLGLSTAAMDYGARFFGNDARPGGVLETPQKLSPEAAARLKSSWEEKHRGGAEAWRVAVLEQGVVWKSMSMPNEDAQWLQTRVFQLSEIARMFQVPLHKLSELSHATFSNIEHQAIEFIRDGVEPWADAIEQEIHRKLLTPEEQQTYFADHDFRAQKVGDLKSQNEAENIEWMNGRASTDELRAQHKRNPLPNGMGKHYWVPVTQQTLENALLPPAPAPAAGDPPPASPPAKGQKVPPPKGPAKLAASIRRTVALSYVPVLQAIGDRLVRKETAAMARSDADPDSFFREHEKYVREAFQPAFECIEESIDVLCRSAGQLEWASLKEREEFVRGYVANLAHRYAKEVLVDCVSDRQGWPGRWTMGVHDRAHYEAMRAGNAFALNLYKGAKVKNVRWILPETGCDSTCMSIATRTLAPSEWPVRVGPPGKRCECQIVAVDDV